MEKKKHPFWYASREMIGIEFGSIKKYLDEMEHTLLKQQKEVTDSAEREINAGRDHEWVMDKYYEKHDRYTRHFPQFLRHSTFTSIYAMLERRLVAICRFYEKNMPVAKSFDWGRGIVPVPAYLLETVNVDITVVQGWDTIKQYQHIRNWIVHWGPDLLLMQHQNPSKSQQRQEDKYQAAGSAIAAIQEIALSGNFIEMSPKFCPNAVDTSRQFYLELVTRLPNDP